MLKMDCKILVTDKNTTWAADVTQKSEDYIRERYAVAKASGHVCVLDANLSRVIKISETDYYPSTNPRNIFKEKACIR